MKNRLIYYIGILSLLLTACSGSEDDQVQKLAEGGKLYGGTFAFMSTEKIKDLLPFTSSDMYAQRLTTQIFEPLFKIDPTSLKSTPFLAEKLTVKNEAKTYVITLRKGVFFHENECFDGELSEMTSEDVKFSLEMACSKKYRNQMAYLLLDHIKGAKQAYAQLGANQKINLPAIKIINPFKIEIELEEASAEFERILSHSGLSIVSKKSFDFYGAKISSNPIGTGPFAWNKKVGNDLFLKRNANYWRKDEFGNQLPFLNEVKIIYNTDKKKEFEAFQNKEIDIVVEIPAKDIKHTLGSLSDAQSGKNVKHKLYANQSLNINYLAFACEHSIFQNKDLRMAFHYALDKQDITSNYLRGDGWAVEHGFVPEMNLGSHYQVKGIAQNIPLAKSLLAKAGYPEGKNFPVLDLYVNALPGTHSYAMCQGVKAQLKQNLNITVNIKPCTLAERDRAIQSGKAILWRGGWIADYVDPETFLSLFYGENIHQDITSVNTFRYRNATYDQIFKASLKELNPEKRLKMLEKCDQIIVNESPAIPIYSDDFLVMVNIRVRDFVSSSFESLDLSSIFIKEPRK